MSWPIEMRYAGAVNLLCECSVHLSRGNGDLRDSIERAAEDFCNHTPGWNWRRIADRIELMPPQATP